MLPVLKITLFIMWLNVLPPLFSLIFREHFSERIDGSRLWIDNRPIFGSHKTIRGFLACIIGGTVIYPLLGVKWQVAAVAAFLAMSGDLLSSFLKRRLGIPSGKNIIGLDQVFEALFPAVFLLPYLHLTELHVLIILFIFIPLASLGSYVWNYLTYIKPPENYPRIIRSTVRLREWRSCHLPLARWQFLFNLTSFLSYSILYHWVFKVTRLREKGEQNALNMEVIEKTFSFTTLPQSFDGFRILFLVDLHLDGMDGLTGAIIDRIKDLDVDLCLIGGDIRMKTYGPMAPCLRQLKKLTKNIRSRHGILGVLGNHDCIEMGPDFEEAGVFMLINDSWKITENGSHIWIAGVDDPHYYKVNDARIAFRNIPANAFVIFMAHSPESYKPAGQYNTQLYLCGHTHGGQICLPSRKPIITNSRAPRYTAVGEWKFKKMTGYTSRGTAASGIPIRFNCPGEITLITLRREDDRETT